MDLHHTRSARPGRPPGAGRPRLVAVLLAGVLAAAGAAVATPAHAASIAVMDPGDRTALAVATQGTGTLDLFATGPDTALHHRSYSGGQWSNWEDLGGSLASAPAAVSWGAGRLDVFARGVDNSLQHLAYQGGTWQPWESLGGIIQSAPAVTSIQSGHLDVFVWGEGNRLWHRVFYNNAWQGWVNLGGTLTSAPAAVSWGANRIDVVARGTDASIQRLVYDGSWHTTWDNLGGSVSSAPAVVSLASGHLDVFARSGSDTLWHRVFYSNAWSAWSDLGMPLASAPAATTFGANRIDLFGLDAANDVWQKAHTAASVWVAPQRLFGLAPQLTVRAAPRVSVVQPVVAGAVAGPVEYAYVDGLGRVVHAHQPNPWIFGNVQWTAISGNEAFTGRPELVLQADGRTQLLAHNRDGDVQLRTQVTADQPGWGGWTDLGGWVTSEASAERLPDGRIAAFAVDADGRLYSRMQETANGRYLPWRTHDDLDLVGTPVLVQTRTGLRLFAADTAGVLRTAVYEPGGTVSGWTTISEPGMTGSPAATVLPGYQVRVVMRAADGAVVTKLQNADGSWPSAWTSAGAFVAAGSPAVILDPVLGRTAIVARDADGLLSVAWETGQGTGAWKPWVVANAGVTTATDPALAIVNTGTETTWIIAFLNVNGSLTTLERSFARAPTLAATASGGPASGSTAAGTSASGASAGGAGKPARGTPVFVEHPLPAAPTP